MSSCQSIKFTGVLSSLANLTSAQSSISARASSNSSRIPVRSQNILSSIVAIPAQSSSLFKRRPVASTPASMPKKTESSILAHVQRLQKTRQTYKTSTAFRKSASKPAQPRPASRPASRVPSTTSTHSSSSSVARTELSVQAHIARVSRGREKSTPVSSSRPSPVTSRKVSPIIQPLQIKKRAAVVDLAQVNDTRERLTVAPLVVTAPKEPTLRSCLKTSAATSRKVVHFEESGGWNVHGIATFQPEAPPRTFISPCDADIQQSLQGRQTGDQYPGHYQLVGRTRQCRWPPPENPPTRRGFDSLPPSRCRACANIAARGTSRIRYRPQQQSVWCADCMASPDRRAYFTPALDDDGLDDVEDDCPNGLHNHYPDTCAYFRNGFKANVRWLYSRYPDYTYAALDAILDE